MRPRWYHQAAVVGYLAIQVLLPLRGLVGDRFAEPRDFTWNMYSFRSRCEGRYELTEPSGQRARLDPSTFFHDPYGAALTFQRLRLPAFHRYLCDGFREAGRLQRLEGAMRCEYPGGRQVVMVRPDADLCSAPNYGVLGAAVDRP